MDRPSTLNATFVRQVKRPGRYGDGRGSHGLSLLVKPMANGRTSKTWSQRLYMDCRPIMIGLGSFPVVTLAEARAKALENRRALAQGIDPRGGSVPTFSEAAEKVIAMHRSSWRDGARSEEIWRSSLQRFAYQRIGDKPVSEITTADIMAILAPIWNTKHETARRLRHRISAVMKWSIAERHRQDNPAGDAITAALPRRSAHVQHHRALPHSDVAAALAAVDTSDAWPATKLGFAFLTLTAARSGEVRGARWHEIDSEAAVWTVPDERTKTGRAWRCPLSAAARRVLEEADALADASGLLFPNPAGQMLSDSTWSKLLREVGVACVPHGMRSSFRDWCGESGVPRELAEACLAHVVGGAEGAYARSDLLEQRRPVMEAWAAYVAP